MITIDFETRSRCDLKACGSSRYARDPSTEVLCLAYAIDDDIKLWHPGLPEPLDLLEEITKGRLVEAHNAMFERLIWRHICHRRFGWPDIPFEQWRCSAAKCSRHTLPRSLGEAGKAIGATAQKDAEGAKIMKKLCVPGKDDNFINDPVLSQRLYKYCIADVEAEEEIGQKVPDLDDRELAIWQLDQKINLRGIHLDRSAVENARAIALYWEAKLTQEMRSITNGAVESPSLVMKLLRWVNERLEGDKLKNLNRDEVRIWLEGRAIPDEVQRALAVRFEFAKASVKKLQAMLDRCDTDNRIRGNLMYYGAATGRWSGAGIQIQNFPRGGYSRHDIDLVHRLLPMGEWAAEIIDLVLGNPLDALSGSLRSFLCAPEGSRLMVCDFASIEARVLAWLAGETELIDTFSTGGDVYKVMASKIYDVPPEAVGKTQRQVGKMAILGLGYGMGAKSFRDACDTMAGVKITKKLAVDVVQTYREANTKIAGMWRAINGLCIGAVSSGFESNMGFLRVGMDGPDLKIYLPSGRYLIYRNAKVERVKAAWSAPFTATVKPPGVPDDTIEDAIEATGMILGPYDEEHGLWAKCKFADLGVIKKLTDMGCKIMWRKADPEYVDQITFMAPHPQSGKDVKDRTYGGKLVENVVQAVARDLLADAMLRVEQSGYPIIATIHDEIVAEAPNGFGSLKEFEALMREVPDWAIGCPVEVEGYESERYRK
jgi:DNA polymerase